MAFVCDVLKYRAAAGPSLIGQFCSSNTGGNAASVHLCIDCLTHRLYEKAMCVKLGQTPRTGVTYAVVVCEAGGCLARCWLFTESVRGLLHTHHTPGVDVR